jgi:hypothetical protein
MRSKRQSDKKTLHGKSHGTLFFRIIATKSRNGSIETLMEASMIQSIPAANHKTGELGIINNAAEAK